MNDEIAHAVCRTRTVFLDISEGRYFCLDPAGDNAFRGFLSGDRSDAAAEALQPLFDRGFRFPPPPSGPLAWRDHFQPATCEHAVGSVSRVRICFLIPLVAWSLLRASRTIRVGGFRQIVTEITRWSDSASVRDASTIPSLLDAYQSIRRYMPWKRTCLLDSLAMLSLLRMFNVRATFVVGVADQPFSAHCWIQSGPRLLNDRLENIANFEPIIAWDT